MDARSLSWKWRTLARLFFPSLSGMITTSKAMWETYEKYYRIKHPVAVIRSPCRFSTTKKASEVVKVDGLRLLSVARLDPVKGHDRLIRAIAATGKAYTLVVCGEGAYRPEINRMVQAAGIGGRVTMAGHVVDVDSVYSGGGVLVMSSYHEGLPNALIEAIVCGCRAVVPENLDGATELMRELGLGSAIVPEDFEENLIATVEGVIRQPDDVWLAGRQRLAEMTRADRVSSNIWDFLKGLR